MKLENFNANGGELPVTLTLFIFVVHEATENISTKLERVTFNDAIGTWSCVS